MNPDANNYNPYATTDDGSCIIQVGGCTITFACNYDPDADYYIAGACDFVTCAGCMDATSCTYDPEATFSNANACLFLDVCGNCECGTPNCQTGIPAGDCDCDGNVSDECGVCGGAGIPAGECDCDGTLPFCGVCGAPDGVPGVCGCMDTTGTCSDGLNDDNPTLCANAGETYIYAYCNYNPDATANPDNVCTVLDDCGICGGTAVEDATLFDGLGGYTAYDPVSGQYYDSCDCDLQGGRWDACTPPVCNGNNASCQGCQDVTMCNYDSTAAGAQCPGCCIPVGPCLDCDYTQNGCIGIGYGCGVAGDSSSCSGCTNSGACNYDASATIDDDTCDFSCIGCMDNDPNTNGGVAENYDATATIPCTDCCNYFWLCEETVVDGGTHPQCDITSTTIITNANGIPNWNGPVPTVNWANYLSDVYGADTTDDFAYCTQLPFSTGDWPSDFLWDNDCAVCTLQNNLTADALKAGIVYALVYTPDAGGPAIGIMTGDKGPVNWNGYTNLDCSFDDLFTVANYNNYTDAYTSVGISQSTMQYLETYATSLGNSLDYSYMSNYVDSSPLHNQGTLTLRWSVFSCCCGSAIPPTYTYECVIDPAGTFANQVTCEAAGDCNISGTPAIPGCTDSTAANYNSNAQTDDGSCIYTWGCQPGVELTNSCTSRETIGSLFTNNNAVIDYFSDPNNYSQNATTTLYKAGMTGVTAGKNDCLSYNNDIYYSIGNLKVSNTKGTVFSGTTWASVITFLIKQKLAVTLSMTRSQVVAVITASLTPGYTLSVDTKQCYCTHAACLCEPDATGTHATERACEDDKTNCCL